MVSKDLIKPYRISINMWVMFYEDAAIFVIAGASAEEFAKYRVDPSGMINSVVENMRREYDSRISLVKQVILTNHDFLFPERRASAPWIKIK